MRESGSDLRRETCLVLGTFGRLAHMPSCDDYRRRYRGLWGDSTTRARSSQFQAGSSSLATLGSFRPPLGTPSRTDALTHNASCPVERSCVGARATVASGARRIREHVKVCGARRCAGCFGRGGMTDGERHGPFLVLRSLRISGRMVKGSPGVSATRRCFRSNVADCSAIKFGRTQ